MTQPKKTGTRPKARRRISDQQQAEFAASHILDTTIPDYEAGLLGDLVKQSIGNKELREKVLDYYRYLKFSEQSRKR